MDNQNMSEKFTMIPKLSWFAITVLIITTIIIIYLIIAAVYFWDLTYLQVPTTGESSFMFWTAIVLGIFILLLLAYNIYELITYEKFDGLRFVKSISIFGILTMIVIFLIIIYLILAAVYFNELSQFIIPSVGIASFMFWSAIVLGVLTLGIMIYSLYEAFTYGYPVVVEAPPYGYDSAIARAPPNFLPPYT